MTECYQDVFTLFMFTNDKSILSIIYIYDIYCYCDIYIIYREWMWSSGLGRWT